MPGSCRPRILPLSRSCVDSLRSSRWFSRPVRSLFRPFRSCRTWAESLTPNPFFLFKSGRHGISLREKHRVHLATFIRLGIVEVSDYGPDVGRHMMTCHWWSRWRPSCPVPLTRYIHIHTFVHTLYRSLLLYLGGSWGWWWVRRREEARYLSAQAAQSAARKSARL